MKISKIQEERILELDVSGKGGKDAQLAAALGFERVSASYYDAIDKSGQEWEFKKQQTQQFLDPYKFSKMSKEEKKIKILFFVHSAGKILEVYETSYNKLIKAMGYTAWDLKAINKFWQRPCFAKRATQPKAELKLKEIKNFKLIWKRK